MKLFLNHSDRKASVNVGDLQIEIVKHADYGVTVTVWHYDETDENASFKQRAKIDVDNMWLEDTRAQTSDSEYFDNLERG